MPKLLDRVRSLMRMRHYSYQTEQTYLKWIRRYIGFHNIRNPADMGAAEVEAFLSHLAVEANVSASTQNQALFALLFLYREVLSVDLAWLDKFTPAKKSSHVPVVLTKDEVKLIIKSSCAVRLCPLLCLSTQQRTVTEKIMRCVIPNYLYSTIYE